MTKDVIDFSAYVERKDLEVFARHLFESNVQLQLEIAQLKEKLSHAESLLIGLDIVPTLGE